MYISNVSIKRPVFVTMITIGLLVLGIVSYSQMNIDLFPDVDFPFVVVTTVYPGAGPEAVSTDVTQKIEDAINPIAGVKHIQSTSQEGVSIVFAEFSLETESIVAAQEVREKVAAVRADLPLDIEDPIVQRFDPAAQPIMSIVMGGERTPKELTYLADKKVKEKIESIEGVGSVEIVGGSEREIQVLLNLDAMNARQITYNDVSHAISGSNFELPAGRLNQGPKEMLVRTMGRFESLDDLKNVIVKNSHGKVVRLADIAAVSDSIAERRSISRFDGKDAVTLQLKRQSGANTVEVARAVKSELDDINALLPGGVKAEVAVDNSVFIEESLHDVQLTIFFGGALAILVIFLFLANIRSTVISAIAIPVSIISTFTAMKFLGFTLNMMSLMALSLAVGLLIDDAIVVIENIYRHIDLGKKSADAAEDGTTEIGLAVMATTFSIVVVFLPVAFMGGIVGQFFYQFGLTIAVSVLVSLFVAFTLTPMMSSLFLEKEKVLKKGSSNPITVILYYWNHFFTWFGEGYRSFLGWTLKHRAITLVVAIGGFVISMMLANFLGQGFMPLSDRGEVYITFESMPGSSLERTSELAGQLENRIRSYGDMVRYQLINIGGEQTPVNKGTMFVRLVDKDQRDISVFDYIEILRKDLSNVPGLSISVASQPSDGGGSRLLEYSVRGPELSRLKVLADSVEQFMKRIPGCVDIDNSEKQARPEIQIAVDKDLSNDLGLNLGTVAMTVRNLVDGSSVSRYKEGNEEYEINLQLDEKYRSDLENLNNIYIKSNRQIRDKDFSVPLRQLASLYEEKSPTEVKRFDRQREIRVGTNAVTGYSLGELQDAVNARIDSMGVPPGYIIAPVGESEIMADAGKEIGKALVLAIIFVYLLLASQFESFKDPFAMGMSLMMAPVGAILALLIFGSDLNIMSQIGIVFLMGLVTKNAILLIDFIKQARGKGMDRTEAILQAGPIRLRPIMMTTLSMIFAMLPLAFGIGPGAEFRAPMAQAVIGGLTSSTLLTLIIVPITYTLLDDLQLLFSRKKRRSADLSETGTDGLVVDD